MFSNELFYLCVGPFFINIIHFQRNTILFNRSAHSAGLFMLHAWMLWIVFGAGRMKDAWWMKAKLGIVSCDCKSVFLVRHGKDLCHCGN